MGNGPKFFEVDIELFVVSCHTSWPETTEGFVTLTGPEPPMFRFRSVCLLDENRAV